MAHGAGDHDHGQAGGDVGEVGRRCLRAEQDERLAAVLQQAAHGARLIAGWGDRAERQVVADPVGRLVQAADEVAVEGVLHAVNDAKEATVVAAQQTGTGVRAIAQFVRGLQNSSPRFRTGSRDAAHDDRDQSR